MTDNKTENARLWFEFDKKNKKIHMDSLNPKTGGQVPLEYCINAWMLMTKLMIKSFFLQMDDDRISEKDHLMAKEYSAKMLAALMAAFPEEAENLDSPKLTNVGVRRTWHDG